MAIQVKICGFQNAGDVSAAVDNAAQYLGFVFYPKSRHFIDADAAAPFIQAIPSSIISVGLFVDPSDEELADVLRTAPLRMIQLHGHETIRRVAEVKELTRLPVMKAIGVASPADIEAAQAYEPVADMLLLDAKPRPGGPTGGNGVVFDWSLLGSAVFSKPWMLAGGLNEQNVHAAVEATGATIVDVSSGVEDASGHKSVPKIKAFLDKAKAL